MKKILTRLCNRASICTTIRFLQVCRFMFLEKRECASNYLTKGKEPDVVMAGSFPFKQKMHTESSPTSEKKGLHFHFFQQGSFFV